MAIPLSMPNSDDIEDNNRLDLLLEQLLITLRQVLMHRRRVAAAVPRSSTVNQNRHRHETTERMRAEESTSSDGVEESSTTTTTTTATTTTTTTTTTRVTPEEERTLTPSLQLPLPDLVIDSPTGKDRQARRCDMDGEDGRGTSWVENGSELIRLAGQLLDQEEVDAKSGGKMKKEEVEEVEEEERRMNVLSLMCPLLGNSVWTTVALLVVWGLLARAR